MLRTAGMSVVAQDRLLAGGTSVGPTGGPAKRAIHGITSVSLLTAKSGMIQRSSIHSISRRSVRRMGLRLLNRSSLRCVHVSLHIPVTGDGSSMVVLIGWLDLRMRRGRVLP